MLIVRRSTSDLISALAVALRNARAITVNAAKSLPANVFIGFLSVS